MNTEENPWIILNKKDYFIIKKKKKERYFVLQIDLKILLKKMSLF